MVINALKLYDETFPCLQYAKKKNNSNLKSDQELISTSSAKRFKIYSAEVVESGARFFQDEWPAYWNVLFG